MTSLAKTSSHRDLASLAPRSNNNQSSHYRARSTPHAQLPPPPSSDYPQSHHASRERRYESPQRTTITALPTMTTCLHRLPFLTPEGAVPLIAHGGSPRNDESVRESMVSSLHFTLPSTATKPHFIRSWSSATILIPSSLSSHIQLFDSLLTTQKARAEAGLPLNEPYTPCIACNNAIAQRPYSPTVRTTQRLPSGSPPGSPRGGGRGAYSSGEGSRPSSIASNVSYRPDFFFLLIYRSLYLPVARRSSHH